MSRSILLLAVAFICAAAQTNSIQADELPWIVVSKDRKGFVENGTNHAFRVWGLNYDHDEKGRLIEDYWDAEWPKVEADFAQMKSMGANVVRVHLQFGKFMSAADKPTSKSLERLKDLVRLAEKVGIYLNLTGLGCYHKADVPAWYDALGETDRWAAQARFWIAVATVCSKSPAIFCYDLMNEPVVPGGKRKDWLGPAFGGKHFVQTISLDQRDRPRPQIAREWIERLVKAIRSVDQRHLITVGLVDWSLDRKGLTSGFVPDQTCQTLDFISVHIYPERGKFDEALTTLRGFQVGKPVVVEETFPLKCSTDELEQFIGRAGDDAVGWVGFYWGKSPDRLRQSKQIADALQLQWLERFEKLAKVKTKKPKD